MERHENSVRREHVNGDATLAQVLGVSVEELRQKKFTVIIQEESGGAKKPGGKWKEISDKVVEIAAFDSISSDFKTMSSGFRDGCDDNIHDRVNKVIGDE